MGKFLMKTLLFALCLAFIAQVSVFASVGVQSDGGTLYQATDINIIGATVNRNSTSGSKVDVNIISSSLTSLGMGASGSTDIVTTETDISVAYSLNRVVLSSTSRTLTIPDGSEGQVLNIFGYAYVSGTVIFDADTQYGWSTITMDATGEMVTLLYIDDTRGWIVIGVNGATVNVFVE